MPAVEDTPCPNCDEKTLTLEERFVAQQTPHSLAGVQPKINARPQLYWTCTACQAAGPATLT